MAVGLLIVIVLSNKTWKTIAIAGKQGEDLILTVHKVEPMVLSLNYWEQSANALKNLIDLQCWAKTVNISKVVEPKVSLESYDKKTSIFHFYTQNKEPLKF